MHLFNAISDLKSAVSLLKGNYENILSIYRI